jgi:hypothetical protein
MAERRRKRLTPKTRPGAENAKKAGKNPAFFVALAK